MHSRVLRRGNASSMATVRQDVTDMTVRNSAKTLLLWEIEFTDTFLMKFCRLRQPKVLLQVVRALGRLADGNALTWRRVDSCHAALPLHCLEFAHPHLPQRSYCVVFSIGVNADRQLQKLTIWTITKKSNLPKKVKLLEPLLRQFSDLYLANCCIQREDFTPQRAELSVDDQLRCVTLDQASPESQQVECVAILKMYEASRPILRFMATNAAFHDTLLELKLPYKLDAREMAIVQCQHSALALGRSGTGKTSVLCRKILETDLSRRNLSLLHGTACDGKLGSVESQLFVTSNFYLRQKVAEEFAKWQQSALAIGNINLDNSESETKTCSSYVLTQQHSLKERSSFPCFFTFDDVLFGLDRLLCPIGSNFFDHDGSFELDVVTRRGRKKDMRKRVTLELFESEYWPHMPAQVRRITSAATLFKQVHHHMKGSLEVMTQASSSASEFMRLIEHHYLESDCRTHTVVLSKEDRVIFLEALRKYETIKWTRGEWDYPDACHAVFHAICAAPMDLQDQLQANYLYVDEIQDLIPAQVVLLSLLCRNTERGLMLFGDAAQCVAPESDFCFPELKDLIFKWWLRCNSSANNTVDSTSACSKSLASLMPSMFYLVRNYRCRSEVLKLANFVIGLLRYFFPGSLDHIEKEQSLLVNDAFTPTYIEGTSMDSLLKEIGIEELTAEDILLVQNSEVKNELCNAGHFMKRNVLTIAESKGLEYSRVIIYNFFKDSGMASNWRVLYSAFPGSAHPGVQVFNSDRHRWLLRELRALYVAITRAKDVIAFYDEDKAARQSFFEIAEKEKLVRCKQEGNTEESHFQFLQKRTLKVGWFERGDAFFRQGLLEEALQCFEKIEDKTGRIAFIHALETKKKCEKALESGQRDHAHVQQQLLECAHTFVGLIGDQIPWDPDAMTLATQCFELAEAFEELATFFYDTYYPRKDWLAKSVKAMLYGRKYEELKDLLRKAREERHYCVAEISGMLLQVTIDTYRQLRSSSARNVKKSVHSFELLRETVDKLVSLCSNEPALLEKLYLPYCADEELFEILSRCEKRTSLLEHMGRAYEADAKFSDRAALCFRKANNRAKAIQSAILTARQLVDHRGRWSGSRSIPRREHARRTLQELLHESAPGEMGSHEVESEVRILVRALGIQIGENTLSDEVPSPPVPVGSRLRLWILQLRFDHLVQRMDKLHSLASPVWREVVEICNSMNVILSEWIRELNLVVERGIAHSCDSAELKHIMAFFLAVSDAERDEMVVWGEHREYMRRSDKHSTLAAGKLGVGSFVRYAVECLEHEFAVVLEAVAAPIQAHFQELSRVAVLNEPQRESMRLLQDGLSYLIRELKVSIPRTSAITKYCCLICQSLVLIRTLCIGIPGGNCYAQYRHAQIQQRMWSVRDLALLRKITRCPFVTWKETHEYFQVESWEPTRIPREIRDHSCVSNDKSTHLEASCCKDVVLFGQEQLQKICSFRLEDLSREVHAKCRALERLCVALSRQTEQQANESLQEQANNTLQWLVQLLEQLQTDSVLEYLQLAIYRSFLVVAFSTDPFECRITSEKSNVDLGQSMAKLVGGITCSEGNSRKQQATLANSIATVCVQSCEELSQGSCIHELKILLDVVGPITEKVMAFSVGAMWKYLFLIERIVVFSLPMFCTIHVPLVLPQCIVDRHRQPSSRWERCVLEVQQSGRDHEVQQLVNGLLGLLGNLRRYVLPQFLQVPHGMAVVIRLMAVYSLLAMNTREWSNSDRLAAVARESVLSSFRRIRSVDPVTQLTLIQEWMKLLHGTIDYKWRLVKLRGNGPWIDLYAFEEQKLASTANRRRQDRFLLENKGKVDQLWQDALQQCEQTLRDQVARRIEDCKRCFQNHFATSHASVRVVLQAPETCQMVDDLVRFDRASVGFGWAFVLRRQMAACFLETYHQIRVIDAEILENDQCTQETLRKMQEFVNGFCTSVAPDARESFLQLSWRSARTTLHHILANEVATYEKEYRTFILSDWVGPIPPRLLEWTGRLAVLAKRCEANLLDESQCAISTSFVRLRCLIDVLEDGSFVDDLEFPTHPVIKQCAKASVDKLSAVPMQQPWQTSLLELHTALVVPERECGGKRLIFLAEMVRGPASLEKKLSLMEYIVGYLFVMTNANANVNLTSVYRQWHRTVHEWRPSACELPQVEEICANAPFNDDSFWFALVAQGNARDPLLLLRSVLLLLLMESCVPDNSRCRLRVLRFLRDVLMMIKLPEPTEARWMRVIRCRRQQLMNKLPKNQIRLLQGSKSKQMLCELVQAFA